MKRSAWMMAAVLGMAAGVMAQNQPGGAANDLAARQRLVEEQARRQEEAAAARLLSVNFPGGTIGQYVEALRKASTGGSANIVVSDRSSKVPISAINLKGVDIGVAVSAIPAAYSGARGAWHIEPVLPNGMPRMGNYDMSTVTYSVDFETVSDYQTGELKVEAFTLGRLLNPSASPKPEANPDVVLTAIEAGLHLLMGNAERRPELKFHPDSSLLFVRGTNEEVQLVKSIISRMTDEAVRRQAMTQRRTHAEQVRNLQMKEAMLRVQIKEMEFQAASSDLDRMKQQVEAGAASTTELSRLQLEIGRAKMNIEMAKLELERAQLVTPDEADLSAGDAGGSSVVPGSPPPVSPSPIPGSKRPNR